MILPTKHIPIGYSLLGLGSSLLDRLDRPVTVSALWEAVRNQPNVATFERYSLALDLLFMIGAVELKDGLLYRVTK